MFGSFRELEVLFWGPYVKDPIALRPYSVPPTLVDQKSTARCDREAKGYRGRVDGVNSG